MVRTVYTVTHDSRGPLWRVRLRPSTDNLSAHEKKADAKADATARANADRPSQVVVFKVDGTIEAEHTYSDDPPRYPS